MIAKFRKTSHGPALAGVLFIALGLVTLTDARTSGKSTAPEAEGGQAPSIVATTPAVGATDVDPGLAEITVRFDQDMGEGFSWTGSGPDHPTTPEGQKAQWRDKRTCVLPVKLEAGRYYRVGINAPSYRGFRSADGVAVVPSAIYFTTQGATDEQKLQMSPPKIVATSPVVGATDVDPAVTEITVTFNQEMGGGMSWTGGGPQFPPSPEGQKAQWRDKRTCVLPVKLEAAHFYRVGINSKSYQNFSSSHGLAALPSAIFFTTQGASDELKAMTLVPQVVKLEPYNGAQNVSPAVTELRVTFSVPMGGGCSWCTVSDDGADYPKGPEGKRVYWTEDKQTCVLPVELKPGMTYRLSLNAPEFKNFQSAGGVPLEPVEYTFKTSGKATETAQAGDQSDEQQHLKKAEGGDKWAAFWLWDSYHRGNNGITADPAKADKWLREFVQNVWVVRFDPVDDFTPASPQEFLERINQHAHTYSGRTEIGPASFFRTTKQGGKLVGSFLSNYPDQLKASLAKVPGLKVTSTEEITLETFIKYEQSPQESL